MHGLSRVGQVYAKSHIHVTNRKNNYEKSMNIQQLADAANIQSVNVNPNQGSGIQFGANGANGKAPNSGDGCCINGVGSKAKELYDSVPPCTGIFNIIVFLLSYQKSKTNNRQKIP